MGRFKNTMLVFLLLLSFCYFCSQLAILSESLNPNLGDFVCRLLEKARKWCNEIKIYVRSLFVC